MYPLNHIIILASVYLRKAVSANCTKNWPFCFLANSVCSDLSLIGDVKRTKLFTWKRIWLAPKGHPSFKVSVPPAVLTLGLSPKSTLQFPSCKRFTAIYNPYDTCRHEKNFHLSFVLRVTLFWGQLFFL